MWGSGARTFTDGYGGDVFTAKDNQLNGTTEAAKELNLGTHGSFELSVNQKSIIEFDLSSIPAGASCLSAKLYLYKNDAAGGRTNQMVRFYSITRANGGWLEGTQNLQPALFGESSWNAKAANGSGGVATAWAGSAGMSTAGIDYHTTPIGSFAGDFSDAFGTEYIIDLNPDVVRTWFGENNANYGILFFVSSETAGHVAASDYGIAGYRPKLVIVYLEE